MAELGARADGLRDEVARATQDGAALREDASAAAGRASEARGTLAEAEKETARLSLRVEVLRSEKAALDSELSGLRHELDALRGEEGGSMGGSCLAASRGAGRRTKGGGGDSGGGGGLVQAGALLVEGGVRYGGERGIPFPSVGRATRRGKMRSEVGGEEDDSDGGGSDCRGGDLGGDLGLVFGEGAGVRAWEGSSRLRCGGRRRRRRCGPEENDLGLGGDAASGGGRGGGNLVEIVAEFQGRLRRQVKAALADGGVSGFRDGTAGTSAQQRPSSFSRVSVGPVRVRQVEEDPTGVLSKGRRHKDGVFYGRAGGSCDDVIGELEQRIGSV